MADDNAFLVTFTDARRLRYCVPAQQEFFAEHGLDFEDFKANGIAAQALLDTGHGYATRLVEHVRRRRADGR